ncbi:hypothetical protein MMC12_002702 [Toensbergia leucococca]|nr:hypothetical protein [Toensbergia leucococca]
MSTSTLLDHLQTHLTYLHDLLPPSLQHHLTALLSRAHKVLLAPKTLRCAIVVLVYFAIRPYLVQLGARLQSKDHDRALGRKEGRVNALRGGKEVEGKGEVGDKCAMGEGEKGVVEEGERRVDGGGGGREGKKARRRNGGGEWVREERRVQDLLEWADWPPEGL